MKTLHLYLTKQVLLTLLMTVAVFTFVLLLGNVLKEIMGLLVTGKVTGGLVLKAIGLLVPYIMAYVLQFGMLTAVVLSFGRFSADQELTASKASGISLVSLVIPVVILSLLLSAGCAVFNLWVAPNCRNAYKDLIYLVGTRNISSLIIEDRFIDDIPGMVFYVREKNGDELKDVRLYLLENGEIMQRASAENGRIIFDHAAQKISFILNRATTEIRQKPPKIEPLPPEFIGPTQHPREPESEWKVARMDVETDPVNLADLMKNERKPRLSEMNYRELRTEIAEREEQGISALPARVQLQRNIAFSFACFAFTLIAIPLAIRAHRRETSGGVAIALLLVMGYYAFFIVAESLATKEHLRPDLLVWLPNFLFQGIGALLMFRANRRG